MKGAYRPRAIDRVVFGVLATLVFASGFYLVGPWYLSAALDGSKAPIINLLDNATAVRVFGVFLVLDGLALFYASAGRSAHRLYTSIVSYALLGGFLLRLYSLIGVIMTLESWRPPTYLSHALTVILFGSYWVWVKVNVRPTQ